jgi:hypothetical protein
MSGKGRKKKATVQPQPLTEEEMDSQQPTHEETEDVPSGEGDDEEDDSQNLSQSQRGPRFSREVEAKIVDWVHQHEFIYMKTHKFYCNHDKKSAVWEDLANELAIEGTDAKKLKQFWDNIRTRYRKLAKKKSGDPRRFFFREGPMDPGHGLRRSYSHCQEVWCH